MLKWKSAAVMVMMLLALNKISAQSDQRVYDLQNVIPPSPNASSLGKYADWPVNLYTGLPEINIPVYTLKGRSVSVPVSLSYHASGIKVGEHASSVGLGWSLQAGGVITRSLRGRPDEEGSAGYLAVRNYYNNPADLSSGSIATSGAFCDSMLQFAIARGDIESEPDLFMFSALGKSYKFYFSGSGKIVTQPYSNVKITADWANNAWTAILEDGTKLLFGGSGVYTEETSTPSVDVYTYTSAWYLRTITSPQGEVITFTYTSPGQTTLDSYFYQTDYTLDRVDENDLVSGTPVTIKNALTKAETQDVSILNLATIESDLGKVYFDTSNSRLDLPGAQKTTSIRVFSKLENKYLEKFNFYYTYSAAASGNVYPYGYSTPLYRLKLDTLEEVSVDGSLHKYWKFGYNPKSLPSRKSYAQDYWGYYNGATGNTTSLPLDPNFNPDNFAVANRSADSASMLAEMLTKITYPTGGYSVFTFEPNGYPNLEEQFGNVGLYPHVYINSASSTNTHTDTIVLTKSQFFNFQFKVVGTSLSPDFPNTYTIGSAVLKNASGTILSSRGVTLANSGTTFTSASVFLAPGTYRFTVSSSIAPSDLAGSQSVDLSASFTYTGSLGSQWVNHKVGGVRIQSIFDYDGIDTGKTIKRYYQYENASIVSPFDSTTDYSLSTNDKTWDCDGTGMTACGLPGCLAYSVIYHTRVSSTKFALGSVQGGTVGYGKVTEKFGPNAENGKNVYYYTNTADINVASAKGFPYPAVISKDYERGLLLEKDVFTAGNVLVSKQTNNYTYVGRNQVKTFKLGYKYNVLSSCLTFNYIGQFINKTYYSDLTDQVQQTSTTQTTYNTATGDSLAVTTNSYYDDTLNMQPVRTVTLNSKGDTVLTYSRTALEKTAINGSITLSATASAAIDTMNAKNMVGIPVESERYVGGVLSNKALTNYKVVAPNSLVLHDNVMVQNASNPIETRVQFTRYDLKGNLVEQQKTSDQKHSYIWDYAYTYPVAEVVNADSANIAYTSFEADGAGNWTVGSSARDTTKGITGTKSYIISNGTVTKSNLTAARAYVVSYWTTNSTSYTSITGNKSGYPIQGKTININGTNWTYFEHKVTGITSVSISGTGNIDELRLYPDTALMTTYAYTPLVGMNSQCDVNNRITYYQYDGFNRLYIVRDQDRNVLKKYCYNYNGQSIACQQYYNVVKSGTFTRNNCGSGYTGGTATYTVPAGSYASLVSQAAADSLAQNDVNLNGQNYANANGTCTSSGYTITSTNNVGVTGFTATFTNTGTSVQTVFNIPAAGGTLGTLPGGTYTVVLAKTGNTTTKYIYTVCTTTKAAAVTATFSGMVIGSSCNTLAVDGQ